MLGRGKGTEHRGTEGRLEGQRAGTEWRAGREAKQIGSIHYKGDFSLLRMAYV